MQMKVIIIIILSLFLGGTGFSQNVDVQQDWQKDSLEMSELYDKVWSVNSDEAIPAAERIYYFAKKYGVISEMFNASMVLSIHNSANKEKQLFWDNEARRLMDLMEPEPRYEAESMYKQLTRVHRTDESININTETDIIKLRGYRNEYEENLEYSKSLKVAIRIVDLQRSNGHIDTENYISDLTTLGRLYSIHNNDSAIIVLDEALRLSINEEKLGLQSLLDTYVVACMKLNLIDKGLIVSDKYIELLRKKYGECSLQLYHAVRRRAILLMTGNRYLESANSFLQAFDIQKEIVKHRFQYMTEDERFHYWEDNFGSSENLAQLAFEFNLVNGTGLIEKAYDQQLLSKGILLNTSNAIRREIEKNPSLISKWNKINNIKRSLLNCQEDDFLQLELESSKIEREISREVDLSSLSKDFEVSYKDIRAVMNEDDLAIEFITMERDDIKYLAALYLDGKHYTPALVYLWSIDDIKNFLNTDYEKTPVLYENVWKVFIENAPHTKYIYFSPTDIFNIVPIENCMTDNGLLMSERFNMYRVSSTKVLVSTKPQKNNTGAVVYGGIDYEADLNDIVIDSKKYPTQLSNSDFAKRGVDAIRNWKTEIKPLSNTLSEANEIVKTLKNLLKPRKLTGYNASEASFKSLSGNSPRIIHIATHGFFWDEHSREKYADLDFLKTNSIISKYEDKTLSYSGVLFSGASNVMKNKEFPDGVENGVCTASEISTLDLSKTDLVVLSACNTGLGVLDSDGVFGLQRGFKKAGVHTLLMSLWEVNDKATMLLMTEFYKHLTTGKSKIESLREAQKYVRNYNNGYYNSKENWAGFILIDGF